MAGKQARKLLHFLSVLTALTVLASASVLPAAAGSGDFNDSTDDVIYYDWDTDQYYERQDWDQVDIHSVAVNATATAVRVTVRIVRLEPGWWLAGHTSYDVDGGAQDFRLYVAPDGQSQLVETLDVNDQGTPVSCSGAAVEIDYTNSQFVTTVPRSCLGNPASVGVAAGTYDNEGYDCDCNDVVMDFFPNEIGTHAPHVPFENDATPPPSSGAYDPNGPMGTIYRLYRAYFLRQPDSAGYEYWLGVYRNGYPLTDISENFSRSREFQTSYGTLEKPQFIRRVYLNVLDREPDPDGYNYWAARMQQGMPRGVVMINFSDSAEFRSKTASGRPPGY